MADTDTTRADAAAEGKAPITEQRRESLRAAGRSGGRARAELLRRQQQDMLDAPAAEGASMTHERMDEIMVAALNRRKQNVVISWSDVFDLVQLARKGLVARAAAPAVPAADGEADILAAVERLEADIPAEAEIHGPEFMTDLHTVLGFARRATRPTLLMEALEADADAFIVLAGYPWARDMATERIRAIDRLLEGQ